jgi:hypothetical protein
MVIAMISRPPQVLFFVVCAQNQKPLLLERDGSVVTDSVQSGVMLKNP